MWPCGCWSAISISPCQHSLRGGDGICTPTLVEPHIVCPCFREQTDSVCLSKVNLYASCFIAKLERSRRPEFLSQEALHLNQL